jgi:hypothetical protein
MGNAFSTWEEAKMLAAKLRQILPPQTEVRVIHFTEELIGTTPNVWWDRQ